MLANGAFRWKSRSARAVVGNWPNNEHVKLQSRAGKGQTRAGESPVKAELILPFLPSGPHCPGAVPNPHLDCKMYLSHIEEEKMYLSQIEKCKISIYILADPPALGLCLILTLCSVAASAELPLFSFFSDLTPMLSPSPTNSTLELK